MKQSSFGRKKDQRDLLLRSLVTSVVLYESVITTEAKGRAIQPILDRLIHVAQQGDNITTRRQLISYLLDENAVKKIFAELVARFGERKSGFTRRYRLPNRLGDGAPQVMIQLTDTIRLEPEKQTAATKA